MKTHSLEVGKKVFIRTVTMYYVGKIAAITDCEVKLEKASWIPLTARWNEMVRDGSMRESEPYHDEPCYVNREVFVDWFVWKHELPTVAK